MARIRPTTDPEPSAPAPAPAPDAENVVAPPPPPPGDAPDASADRSERARRRAAERTERPQGMVPGRERRRTGVERGAMRLVSTGGIVGIATLLGAILVSQDLAGWIVGLAIGLVSVVLAAVLWSSRQL